MAIKEQQPQGSLDTGHRQSNPPTPVSCQTSFRKGEGPVSPVGLGPGTRVFHQMFLPQGSPGVFAPFLRWVLSQLQALGMLAPCLLRLQKPDSRETCIRHQVATQGRAVGAGGEQGAQSGEAAGHAAGP